MNLCREVDRDLERFTAAKVVANGGSRRVFNSPTARAGFSFVQER